MVLEVDLSRALRGGSALHELVLAVADAGVNDESDSVEWKRTLDLNSKAGAFEVARAVLGMANREPSQAATAFEGCGYLVVGAEPRRIEGVGEVDPAQLSDLADQYIGGARGPRWTPTWVSVSGKSVLVVTIEPPGAGDVLWPLRREYEKKRAGTLFVRRLGKTVTADDKDVDMLSARASQVNVQHPELDVEVAGALPLPWFIRDGLSERISEWVKSRQEVLIAEAKAKHGSGSDDHSEEVVPNLVADHQERGLAAMAALFKQTQDDARRLAALGLGPTYEEDDRTIEEYRQEVAAWAERWQERSLEEYAWRFSAHDRCRVRVVVRNNSSQFLTDVEVRVHFPQHDAFALETVDTPGPLPTEPPAFGEQRLIPGKLQTLGHHPSITAMPHFGFKDFSDDFSRRTFVEDGSITITFEVGDLRPMRFDTSDAVWVFLPSCPEGGSLNGTWEVTARGVHHLMAGSLQVPVQAEPTDLLALLQEPVGSADDHDSG